MIYSQYMKNAWAYALMDSLVEGRAYVGHMGEAGYAALVEVLEEFIEQQGGALSLVYQVSGGRIIVHLVDSGDRNVWN